VDAAITEIMERDGVAGLAACLIDAGEIVWCGGYGHGNPDTDLLATPRTPFLLASVSKAVTAVAVMQAVEAGALGLDDPINEHLPFAVTHPDAPNTDITGRHLMAHTSGIVDNWDALEAHYVTGDSTEDLGAFLEGYLVRGGADFDADQNFAVEGVGALSEYSNTGAALAGFLVEAATGTPFDDGTEVSIFEPLGMNAGWHLADFDDVAQIASPTDYSRGAWDVLDHYGFPDYPNGQLRADAWSMARFLAAVSQGGTADGVTVLDQDSVDALWQVHAADLDADQGLIWYHWDLDGDRVVGHNGGEVGASTEIVFRPRDGRGVVVLMNSEGRGRTLADVELVLLDATGL
jgi:CubicO group peptidase (beta-lactamase class C family)